MKAAEALLRPGRMLIGGEWVDAGSGEFVARQRGRSAYG